MKTLQEYKEEVARKRGCADFDDYVEQSYGYEVVAIMDEVAELYASQYRSPSTPDFLEALKSEWIKHFGSLNDNHERDGYFMVGFVSEVLKQFRPSTVEKESYTKEQMNEAFEAGVDAIDYDELEGFTRNASFDDFLKTLPSLKEQESKERYFRCDKCGNFITKVDHGQSRGGMCTGPMAVRTSGICGGGFTIEMTKEEYNTQLKEWGHKIEPTVRLSERGYFKVEEEPVKEEECQHESATDTGTSYIHCPQCQNVWSKKERPKKLFTIAFIRDLETQVFNHKITYSQAVEILNETVEKGKEDNSWISEKLKAAESVLKCVPLDTYRNTYLPGFDEALKHYQSFLLTHTP
jgi:hypothetical protein